MPHSLHYCDAWAVIVYDQKRHTASLLTISFFEILRYLAQMKVGLFSILQHKSLHMLDIVRRWILKKNKGLIIAHQLVSHRPSSNCPICLLYLISRLLERRTSDFGEYNFPYLFVPIFKFQNQNNLSE